MGDNSSISNSRDLFHIVGFGSICRACKSFLSRCYPDKNTGADPADVIFTITEQNHPVFTRKEDDLELKLDIPLVEALTGCTLSVPLLGGQTMSLTINDVINPGYQKIIAGQGMPKQNEPNTRGNLIITFSVKFPQGLTDEQRSDAADILQQTC